MDATPETRRLIASYDAWQHPKSFERAKAVFDSVHAEARSNIAQLCELAEKALDAGDLAGARAAVDQVRRHEAVRDLVESLWIPPGSTPN